MSLSPSDMPWIAQTPPPDLTEGPPPRCLPKVHLVDGTWE